MPEGVSAYKHSRLWH